MKPLTLCVLFILSFGVPAHADENLSGKWLDKSYDFNLRESSGNLFGEYDKARTDLFFREETQNVFGKLPCGTVDLYYRTESKNVFGEICGSRIDSKYSSAEETVSVAQDLLVSALADSLPQPIRSQARAFVLKRLKL